MQEGTRHHEDSGEPQRATPSADPDGPPFLDGQHDGRVTDLGALEVPGGAERHQEGGSDPAVAHGASCVAARAVLVDLTV